MICLVLRAPDGDIRQRDSALIVSGIELEIFNRRD
jgi:hypothetical protein